MMHSETAHSSQFWIRQVQSKLASGIYRLEDVDCFCGSQERTVLVQQDRYGMEYCLALCMTCGLLYATPRMTAATFQQFYDCEYRNIYLDTDEEHATSIDNGFAIWDILKHQDLLPKTVLDIGCNRGAMLQAFQEHGCEVLGVDLDHVAIARGLADGRPVQVGSLESVVAEGRKADLVILHHVLEHALDLREMLANVQQLLTPNGALWIGVPGIRTISIQRLFQNAHTYQFSYDTLQYVMECCGWSCVDMNDNIDSLWRYTGRVRAVTQVIPEAIEENLDILGRNPHKLPQVRTYNKFPLVERRANIEAWFASGLPDVIRLKNSLAGRQVVIIGGGPSVDAQLPALRKLKEEGAVILAIERMYQWSVRHDLTPDYVVVLDASPDVLESLAEPHRLTTHLIASQTLPAALDILRGYKNYLFHVPQLGVDYESLWVKYGVEKTAIITAGGSVVMASMALSMVLGMKQLHLFGFDCHITQADYVAGITGVGVQARRMEIVVDGKDFVTTPSYLSFAQDFFKLVQIGKERGHLEWIKVYGDSLVTAMSVENLRGDL